MLEGLTLAGRTALVTGGAGGIGSHICRDLAALGARVLVVDVNAAGARKVADDLPDAEAYVVDLARPESISELVATVLEAEGGVDVLVNNAGWDRVEPFLDNDPSVWDKLIAINFRAPVQLTQAFLPGQVERSWGRLVYVSSDAARNGSKGEAVYAGCKAGLLGFMKTIAREVARAGITSNAVCPGPSDTPLLREVADANPKLVAALERAIPLGRLGQPRDVAGVVAFLTSERAEYLTGQTVSVSGGLSMV